MFSELYGAYYNTMAKLIEKAVDGTLDNKVMNEIIANYAFSESVLQIVPAINEEKWQLIKSDFTTPLHHTPTMPLTNLQKSWLKAVMLDKRFKLFGVHIDGLDDIEPLFTTDDYFVFDRYADGDDFENEEYINNFRLIVDAIKNKDGLKIETLNRHNKTVRVYAFPHHLEYSSKDDKFRLITSNGTINLGRIILCKKYNGAKIKHTQRKTPIQHTVTLEVTDTRNTLERVMLHFAHFEKYAEMLENNKYKIIIKYDKDDETEMIIRVLSFGPYVKVIEPQSFEAKLKKDYKNKKT